MHNIGTQKNISAIIDFRYDAPDLNAQGQNVNSFNAVKPFLDRIKSIGYSSVTFQTNVPINIDTGDIVLFDSAGNPKTAPKDLWALCKYAKSLGLDVSIKLDISDYRDDAIIGFWTKFGSEFTYQNFFQSIKNYEKFIAINAQESEVDVIYVGNFSNGLDTENYRNEWTEITSEIRSVFGGKLGYVSNANRDQCAIWEMVDIIGLDFNPVISEKPIFNFSEILKKFYVSDSNGSDGFPNPIQDIKNYSSYNKQLELSNIAISAANIGWQYPDFMWPIINSEISADDFNIDYEFQGIRFQSIFYLLENDLSNYVSGVSFREYNPWEEATWIEKGEPPTGKLWKSTKELAFSLYDNIYAESVFRNYFKNKFLPFIKGPSIDLQVLVPPENDQYTYADIWIMFSNKIEPLVGEIYLFDSNQKLVEKFKVGSSKAAVINNALVINPSKDLKYDSTYTLKINSGIVKDDQGNSNKADEFLFKTTDTFITISNKFYLKDNIRKVGYFGDKNFNGIGSKYDDTISGGFGDDSFSGRMGNDTLTGGSGNDTFVFNSKLGPRNIDAITDFSSGSDKIALDDAFFKRFIKDKNLSDNFIIGSSASASSDYIIYDSANGKLYYDADGNGNAAAIQIALLGIGSHPTILANDFVII